MSTPSVRQLVETIEADPVSLEENGFPADQLAEVRASLEQNDGDEFIDVGLSVLQIATGLHNLGHETPVAQLKTLLDEIGPKARELVLARGSDSDAEKLAAAAQLVGTKGHAMPAQPGDEPPDGAVTVQAFKIPVR